MYQDVEGYLFKYSVGTVNVKSSMTLFRGTVRVNFDMQYSIETATSGKRNSNSDIREMK